MEMPENVSADQVQKLFFDHIEIVNPSLETVNLRPEGKRSTTTKIGNLRFRIRELLEEILKLVSSSWSTHGLVIVVNVIQFVREVNKLATIDVTNEAKVLYALWVIKSEKSSGEWPTIEEVRTYLKNELTEGAVDTLLDNLRQLDCVADEENGKYIFIKEEIVLS
jgi:hypothetical protein